MKKTRASQYPMPPNEPFDINNKAHRDLFRGYVTARLLDTMDMIKEMNDRHNAEKKKNGPAA